MDEKNKAKAEEAKLTSGLVRLGVSVALSTLLAIPSMGATFSLAALSGAVMSDFTDHAAVFARAELIHRAHQAVVKSWDEPGHNTDEVLAANVDKISDLASVDIKISAASLYSLYRSTRIQLNSIGETAELVSYRTGVSPADSASFSLSSRQAMKSVNEIQKVLDRRWNALNTACDGRVRSAIHSVQVYSKATVKGADTAFAEMIRAKTECLASQYVLLVTEIRWMAALANEAIYACQAMSAVKFAQ